MLILPPMLAISLSITPATTPLVPRHLPTLFLLISILFGCLFPSPHLQIIKALIECGADVKARGSRIESPLHSAVNAEVTRLLVKAGADLEAKEIGVYKKNKKQTKN